MTRCCVMIANIKDGKFDELEDESIKMKEDPSYVEELNQIKKELKGQIQVIEIQLLYWNDIYLGIAGWFVHGLHVFYAIVEVT